MAGKSVALRLLITGSLALVMSQSLAAQTPELSFVFPQDGQIVAGQNVLVWVAKSLDASDIEVVFEFSLDGGTFQALARQEAPDFDFGQLSQTTALDTTDFPIGPLFLRARNVTSDTGPVIQVTVHRLPEVSCEEPLPGSDPLRRDFDCSGSFSEEGQIVRYNWDFGDGTTMDTSEPTASHSYSDNGEFPFQMTAFDDLGFSSTFLATVTVGPGFEWSRTKCGCLEMTVHTAGASILGDPRRPQPGGGLGKAPLGQDPDYVSFNFEVTAALEAGSDPALCEEGQLAKGTSKLDDRADEHKRACTAGRSLAICANDHECDTHTCHGGLLDGRACEDGVASLVCEVGGGQCQSNNDGACTAFPLAGPNRGSDDYRRDSPADEGIKLHCPTCQSPIWLDLPGTPTVARGMANADYRQEADFLMFLKGAEGGGSCSCHVSLLIDWDGTNHAFRAGTGLTVIRDAESVMCR